MVSTMDSPVFASMTIGGAPPRGTIPTDDRFLCGWRVASALPLPDLLPWTGGDGPADLRIEVGPVPERLTDTVFDQPLLQVAADGTCRFQVPGVAAYLIDADARRVVVEPAMAPDAPDIRVFLYGTVLGLLCYRRGLVPLHASCVRIGDGAVAMAGASGMGKSTLAAALLRRGCPVLSDDVTVIDLASPDGPRVLPAFPRLKLWGDAMARMGFAVDGLERSRPELEKFHLPVETRFSRQSVLLRAVFHLTVGPGHEGGTTRRLHGPEAAAGIWRDLYRNGMMVRLGQSKRLLSAAVALTGIPDGIWTITHPHDAGCLDRSVAAILERMAA